MKQMLTRWGKTLEEDHILTEYPRPLMKRNSCTILNGWWECTFAGDHSYRADRIYDKKIRVPFSPEACLSGVSRQLGPDEYLFYRKFFSVPGELLEGQRLILHFGAVDQNCKVYINGKKAVCHRGGYLPFETDITELVRKGGQPENELVVCVQDQTDCSSAGRGKQMLKCGGMFYTAQSGIWQTVWMECVDHSYIKNVWCGSFPDERRVEIHYEACGKKEAFVQVYRADRYDDHPVEEKEPEECPFQILISEKGRIVIELPKEEIFLWSPDTPYLYYFKLKYGRDEVLSYFALRSITIEKDEKGQPRICLNHQFCFQNGVLDQGYWPDGLYTPPSDEAYLYDIRTMKELGYNMIRKHIKVESQRWYYHCDRLGMLVWQDMINGGGRYQFWFVTYAATLFNLFELSVRDTWQHLLSRKEEKGKRAFEREMTETIRCLKGHPSIVTWVLFNEGWGQFDTVRLTQKIREEDPERLIDSASGWFDQKCGDLKSQHYYFFRLRLSWEKERATVLSEMGGFPYRVAGHSVKQKIYGYHLCRTWEEFQTRYRDLKENLRPQIERGLSASVYTQLSDVEEEVNGILTYDREICKMNPC